MMNKLVNGIDTMLGWLGGRLKQNLPDYIDIETAHDAHTLVSTDGSLVTLIKINGVSGVTDPASFESGIREPLTSSLGVSLNKKDHNIQVWFSMDGERIQDELRTMLSPAFETAKRLQFDATDILEERIKNLSKYCAVEECFMAVWTTEKALTNAEIKSDKAKIADKREAAKAPKSPIPAIGQDTFKGLESLRHKHIGFAESVVQELKRCGVIAKKIGVREAMRAMRRSIDPHFTSDEWDPRLPGDKVLPSTYRQWHKQDDDWSLQWPRFGWQLCPRDAELVDANTVSVGDRIYAPVFMHLAPKDVQRFVSVFNRLIDIPWRVSYMIGGDGMSSNQWKRTLNSFLKMASTDNQLIAAGMEELKNLELYQQQTIVRLQIMFCTWAEKDQIDLLQRRRQVLAKAIESWGGCEAAEVTGDPVAGMMSSALAVTKKSIATMTAAPLGETIRMLPLTRPTSAWDKGAVLFRSLDGKVLPFQPGSSKQTTWISLAFARPGSGKSVLMNVTNFALCLADGIKQLPRIAIIDIGPSSSGLISLIKESLPEDKRHLVVYERLQNTKKYAINPFDTQLGARFPTSSHRDYLINLTTLLVTDPAVEVPAEGMIGLVTDIIDEVYRQRSDTANPKRYSEMIDTLVDDAIKEHRIQIDGKATWWEIVDALFIAGEIRMAKRAQRYAVPNLSDLPQIANNEKFRQKYTNKTATQEDIIKAFSRTISNAQGMYPILSTTTKFDLGEARVVALDLDEVARGGGVMGARQTQVMYMLGRQVTSGDFYLNANDLNTFPAPDGIKLPKSVPAENYKSYHGRRIDEIRENLKRVCYDEFHRTGGSAIVRNQIVLDMREGRKWGVDIMLASQSVGDFDKDMREFATAIYIMDPGTAENVNALQEMFGLSQAERGALSSGVRGPSKSGVTFFGKFVLSDGSYNSLLTLTVGAMEMWALNTTVESVAIRRRLYEKVGPKTARKILAMKYPDGSAKADVEEMKARQKEKDGFVNAEKEENLYDEIVAQIIKQYAAHI
jgi:intracellular multiplication protein IcmB